MRLFKASLAASATISLLALAGCTNSFDDSGANSKDLQQSSDTVRPGHYETATTPNGKEELPYQGSKQDHMETIEHPGGVQQRIYDPSGGK